MNNSIINELWINIEANIPFIALNTYEEMRALSALKELSETKTYNFYEWSVTTNLFKIESQDNPIPQLEEGAAEVREVVLKKIYEICLESKIRNIIVLKDFFHESATITEAVLRNLRDLSFTTQKTKNMTIIFLSPSFINLPKDIENDTVIINFPLPDIDEIESIFRSTTTIPDDKKLPKASKQKIFQSVLGLTSNEIQRSIQKYLLTKQEFTENAIEFLQANKREIIKKQKIISFYTTAETLNKVGGLENLKTWLEERKNAWDIEAEDFGIEKPRGLILTGVPGCGKSLVAKVISKLWKLPLLHLDIGRLFGSLVGQSEENISRALHTAEAVSPCVLWIDEIDKGFGGVSGAQGDSGTLLRVFGHFLEWLQEKTKPVFVVATSNNPQVLPSEFFRAGRWDQRFFVDLPIFNERMKILQIHLKKKKKHPHNYDIKSLAAITEGYSGAEIEQLIKDALFIAYKRRQDTNNRKDDLTQKDLISAVKRMTPLSQFQKEAIHKMREWAKGRTVNASKASDDFTQYVLEPEEEYMIAVHEASHAIVSWRLDEKRGLPDRISVEISRYTQPYTLSTFSKPLGLYTHEDIFNEIDILYAGRIGEETLKKPNQTGTFSGSSNDIQRATTLAIHAVTQLSLQDQKAGYNVIPINYKEMEKYLDYKSIEDVNKKIKDLLTKGKSKAEKLVKEHIKIIDKLANELMKNKILFMTDIEQILLPFKQNDS